MRFVLFYSKRLRLENFDCAGPSKALSRISTIAQLPLRHLLHVHAIVDAGIALGFDTRTIPRAISYDLLGQAGKQSLVVQLPPASVRMM